MCGIHIVTSFYKIYYEKLKIIMMIIIIIIINNNNNNKESLYYGETWQTLPQQDHQIDTKTDKSCW